MNLERTWMRIAVSNLRLNTPGDNRHWRLFVKSAEEDTPIKGLEISGSATGNNFQTKSVVPKDPVRNLAAWICLFGNVRVEGEVAYVELLNPDENELREGVEIDLEGTLSLRTPNS